MLQLYIFIYFVLFITRIHFKKSGPMLSIFLISRNCCEVVFLAALTNFLAKSRNFFFLNFFFALSH